MFTTKFYTSKKTFTQIISMHPLQIQCVLVSISVNTMKQKSCIWLITSLLLWQFNFDYILWQDYIVKPLYLFLCVFKENIKVRHAKRQFIYTTRILANSDQSNIIFWDVYWFPWGRCHSPCQINPIIQLVFITISHDYTLYCNSVV